ncbi:MAG: DUF1924 domain-containing protein [Hyphomicrobiaceae bacterium]|nr:DUF1924 domain-containing protein [Hyphomicrobiaceae bacterium]
MSLRAKLLALAVCSLATAAFAGPAQKPVVDHYTAGAGGAASAERGRAFFTATHTGGKPDTPTCTACHGTDLKAAGKTRAGKPIDPMAVSANPRRLTDLAETEKWFGRNCDSVLGRACTPAEKADVVAYLNGL